MPTMNVKAPERRWDGHRATPSASHQTAESPIHDHSGMLVELPPLAAAAAHREHEATPAMVAMVAATGARRTQRHPEDERGRDQQQVPQQDPLLHGEPEPAEEEGADLDRSRRDRRDPGKDRDGPHAPKIRAIS